MGATVNRIIYMVGFPGSGKTSVMSQALSGLESKVEGKPFKHTIYSNGLVQLGYTRDVYGGTDALSFNVQPKVIEWAGTLHNSLVLAEGDRLANNKFFSSLKESGWDATLVHLRVPELVAHQRAHDRGSNFNATWMKGRVTKVDNLVQSWDGTLYTLDGKDSVESNSKALSEIIDQTRRKYGDD